MDTEEEVQRGKTIRHYLVHNKAYGETGIRDDNLQLDNVSINVSFTTLKKKILSNTNFVLGTHRNATFYSISYRENDSIYSTC